MITDQHKNNVQKVLIYKNTLQKERNVVKRRRNNPLNRSTKRFNPKIKIRNS